MKLAVVGYPDLDDADRRWIESFRAKHDPQATRLGAHFTFVFPVEAEPGEIVAEIAAVAQSIRPIDFSIRRASVVADPFGKGSHIFLVPDRGAREISALHDRLYAGSLRPHLRADIPFVPHITIAACEDAPAAMRLADELGLGSRAVRGTIDSLDVIDIGAPLVQAIAQCALGREYR